jgi:hypothetical protein
MERFELRAEHVTLLRAANVWWWGAEYGAPCIDPKRPYGNGDVENDIGRLLGATMLGDDGDGPCYSSVQRAAFRTWHKETEKALQVILASGSFEPGVYVADKYSRRWRRHTPDQPNGTRNGLEAS